MDPAAALASRLAKYAYSPAKTPPRRTAGTPTRTQPLRSSKSPHFKSEPATPTRTQSPHFQRVKREPGSPTPAGPEADSDLGSEEELRELNKAERAELIPEPEKRRADGSLEKFGWKKPRRYATEDKYAHLPLVGDCLDVGLDLVFCGINPGQMSSKTGHHFAHPTNKFWRALHMSGLTPRLLTPAEDVTLPKEYNYGMTNLVDRPTAEQAELSPAEMRASVLPLVEKLAAHRPKVVCFVGKKIYDIFESVVAREVKAKERAERRAAAKVAAKSGSGSGSGTPSTQAVRLFQLAEDGVVEVPGDISKVEVTAQGAQEPPAERADARALEGKFAYNAPQRLRLCVPSSTGEVECTYFWVVPNTSGLERTPLPVVVSYFAALREFVARRRNGEGGEEREDVESQAEWLDFSVADVERIVEEMGNK